MFWKIQRRYLTIYYEEAFTLAIITKLKVLRKYFPPIKNFLVRGVWVELEIKYSVA